MKILLLETSSESALLASLEDGQVNALILPGGPELSKTLGARIQDILNPPYQRIVVGIGPGSFTGIRVGCSMASALALGWKIPLYAVSSLTAFAPSNGTFTVAVDARMGGIYIQKNFEMPKLYPLVEAAAILAASGRIVSPHPDKISARIPGLSIEKREPDARMMVQYAVEASHPLKIYY